MDAQMRQRRERRRDGGRGSARGGRRGDRGRCQGDRQCQPPSAARRARRKGLVVPRGPVLAAERVVHIGEPVVMIVADSAAAAQDAAESVAVDYEEFEPVKRLRPTRRRSGRRRPAILRSTGRGQPRSLRRMSKRRSCKKRSRSPTMTASTRAGARRARGANIAASGSRVCSNIPAARRSKAPG